MKVNQIKPTYTHYLESEMTKINEVARTSTKETLVLTITNIIKPSASTYVNSKGKRLPTKKRKFLKIINGPRMTNDKIIRFCRDSINKARTTEAKYNNLPTE